MGNLFSFWLSVTDAYESYTSTVWSDAGPVCIYVAFDLVASVDYRWIRARWRGCPQGSWIFLLKIVKYDSSGTQTWKKIIKIQ